MTLKLHNTLTKRTDEFVAQHPGKVKLYTCGPTVYDYLHVGNWSAYIYWDTLVRTLIANDYDVERVMNITDVGHLTSDEDEGEDKLEKGARRENKTAWDVAKFYSDDFLAGMERLNLIKPEHITKATEYIPQQLALVQSLNDKGYTYQIDDGIYFDTAKFPTYAQFAGLNLEAQRAGARVEFNAEKRNPSDFALWKFTPAGETRDMEWETPANLLDRQSSQLTNLLSADLTTPTAPAVARDADKTIGQIDDQTDSQTRPGFPGWHLECSAMAMSILGSTLDIHTGGIDHIPVHHTNEIAQSEASTGERFSNYWLHNNHLKVDGTKISKSLQNGYTLDDLEERGFSPIMYRLFVLQSHYRTEGNFTFENLIAAKNRLANWQNIAALRHQIHDTLVDDQEKSTDKKIISLYATSQAIIESLNDDLNTPAALTIIDEAFAQVAASNLNHIHRQPFVQLLDTIDSVLGLQLIDSTPDISDAAKRLIIERERARDNKDWQASDHLRDALLLEGVAVRDTSSGTIWYYV